MSQMRRASSRTQRRGRCRRKCAATLNSPSHAARRAGKRAADQPRQGRPDSRADQRAHGAQGDARHDRLRGLGLVSRSPHSGEPGCDKEERASRNAIGATRNSATTANSGSAPIQPDSLPGDRAHGSVAGRGPGSSQMSVIVLGIDLREVDRLDIGVVAIRQPVDARSSGTREGCRRQRSEWDEHRTWRTGPVPSSVSTQSMNILPKSADGPCRSGSSSASRRHRPSRRTGMIIWASTPSSLQLSQPRWHG